MRLHPLCEERESELVAGTTHTGNPSKRPAAAAAAAMKRGHIIGACALTLALIGLIVGLLVGRDGHKVRRGRQGMGGGT